MGFDTSCVVHTSIPAREFAVLVASSSEPLLDQCWHGMGAALVIAANKVGTVWVGYSGGRHVRGALADMGTADT